MARAFEGQMKFVDGEWRVRVSEYDAQGKRSRVWYGLGTTDKALAEQKRARVVAEVQQRNAKVLSTSTLSKTPTFEAYARGWQAKRKAEGIVFAESEIGYLEGYIFKCNVGTEKAPLYFGALLLSDVRPKRVRKVLEDARAAGRSKQTVQHIRATMSRIMRQAVEDEIIDGNPVDKVRTPRM
jgi:hypothetical protein